MPGERVRVGRDQGVKRPSNRTILREQRRRAGEHREPDDNADRF
jgi:hypothetical protein